MITVSPTRTSLRCTSSSLCSVALETVTPPTNTGCRRAVGVIAPVRPTCTSMAVTAVMASSAGNLCARAQRGALGRHAQAPLLQLFQDGAVALGQVAALHHTDPITIHVEWSARRDARIELTQAACRGVARIRKYLFAALLLAPIQFGEAAFGHIHLAAHLEAPRRMCAHEAQWHRMYGAHVLRHVLAGVAVAARRRPHQHTVLVQEAYGETVQLRLRRVMHRRHLQSLACASIEFAHLVLGKGIVERQHRQLVAYLAEGGERRAAHALCRRIWRHQRGILRLHVLKFT